MAFPFERKVREIPESVTLIFNIFEKLDDRHKVLGVFKQPDKPAYEVIYTFFEPDFLKKPPEGKELRERSNESSSNTGLFVTLIIAFSVLDHIWTMLASHDGSMRELNPIGKHLLSDPILLACFKTCTTGVAVGILIYLRSHPRVHLAAWWLCLLLTLMTARWLVFTSTLV